MSGQGFADRITRWASKTVSLFYNLPLHNHPGKQLMLVSVIRS